MRLHGDREPRQPQFGDSGGATCCSGASNEIWSYGEKVYDICVKYIHIREKLRDYTRRLMKEAHEIGTPVMRTLFYQFPEDETCWDITDEYMYGDLYLVAPVLYAGIEERNVYLPKGNKWKEIESELVYTGGATINIKLSLESMPVFERI